MGWLDKLFTAFRGATHEVGEAVIDTQAIRILEQEVRDAKKHLSEAKENLARMIAEQMGVEREVKRLEKSIEEYEDYAIQALDKGDETLAEQIAQKIADLENECHAQHDLLESYNANINLLKQNVRDTEHNIKSIEREISVIKTTESVQKANAAAATQFSGSNSALRTATESLERIKEKQQRKADQMKAAMQLQQEESGGDLQAKLKAAGIVSEPTSSDSVLERLKTRRAKKNDDIRF